MILVNRNSFAGGYRLAEIEKAKTKDTAFQKLHNEVVMTMPVNKKQKETSIIEREKASETTTNGTEETAKVEEVKVAQTTTNGTENIVIPDTQGGIVVVRPDRQVFRKKILDFTEEYSRILAVTFGVSAFLFNLGSTTVLNRRSVIWSGVAVVVVVMGFLIWHDRNKLFVNAKQNA